MDASPCIPVILTQIGVDNSPSSYGPLSRHLVIGSSPTSLAAWGRDGPAHFSSQLVVLSFGPDEHMAWKPDHYPGDRFEFRVSHDSTVGQGPDLLL